MLADVCEQGASRSPRQPGGTAVGLHLHMNDVDAVFARAPEARAKAVQPLKAPFHGDGTGLLEDPFGHLWFLATHKEDLPPAEIEKRVVGVFAQNTG